MEIDEASLLQDESNQNYEYKRVNDEMMKALKAIKILDLESRYNVQIIGHTDSIGSLIYNQSLSEKRCVTVKEFLIKLRKGAWVFQIQGNSFKIPIAPNALDLERAKNRRCEIKFEKINPSWEMPVQVFSINNFQSCTLITKNGCKILVDPGSFKVEDNDTVRILISEYNDPIDFIGGGFPMSFSKEGNLNLYRSEQMMKVEAFVKEKPFYFARCP